MTNNTAAAPLPPICLSLTAQCVRYLEFIEGQPPGCSMLLVQAILYTCYVSLGLEMKASRRLITLREAYNDEYTAGRM